MVATVLASSLLNGALDRQDWARRALAAHAGKRFRLRLTPFPHTLRIEQDGRLAAEPDEAGGPLDLDVELPVAALPLALLGPGALAGALRKTGDEALAACLGDIAIKAPWILEDELARLIGPIAAQRVAGLARALSAWPAYAAGRLGEAFQRHLTDEEQLLAAAADARGLAAEIARTREGVDRLEARVRALRATAAARD